MAGIDSIRTGPRSATPLGGHTAPLNAEATRALVETIKGAVALTPDEKEALAALSPEQRAQYQNVAARLAGPDREALAKLLIEGKLTGGRDLKLRGDLLGNLATLATEPLGAGLDRREVLSQAIRGVTDPSTITQGEANTCGAASVQIMLAKENPAEYVRILAGLASAEGKVELMGGQKLERPKNWGSAAIPGAANQLLQTSLMAYAAGGYDAATDTRADGEKGLYASEEAYLQEGVLGKAVTTIKGDDPDLLAKISAQANSGKPVSVLIIHEGKGHYVDVTSVKNGKLTYIDPRDGKSYTVDAAGFAKEIEAANIDAAPDTALRKARPTDKSGSSGGCGGIIGAVVNAVKSVAETVANVVKKVVDTVADVAKKALDAVKNIAKAVVNTVVSVAKATFAVFKTIAKTALTLAQTAVRVGYYLATLRVGSAINAAKEGFKEAWEEVKEGAKEVWKHTKDALKNVGKIITEAIKLAEAVVPGFKLVTDFLKSEIGQKIMMALGILAMIPPLTAVLGPIMLAYALYQGVSMLGKGLETGDFKTAAMGLMTAAASYIGLGGATGGITAGVSSKAINIASATLKAGVAIDQGDWKGAILAGAAVGAAAGGSATAQQVTNVATKGFAVAEAVEKKDWLAVGAGVAAVGAAGLALAAADVDDSKPKTGIAKAWDDAKKWVGDKFEAFKESPVGQVVMAPVNLVKAGIDKADQFLFGSYDANGVRVPDGVVPKATAWFKENVQQPVANAFAPAKEKFAELREEYLDKNVQKLRDPIANAGKAADDAAYGKDGKSGAFGAVKDSVDKGATYVKDGVEKGAAYVRDGAANLANKASAAMGKEPTATPGTAGATPGAATAAATGGPATTAAQGPVYGPEKEPGTLQKAWNWVTGKADAAQTNANNLAGKYEVVRADAARVQNDLAAKLEAINKTHDTFMAGVETVRAVSDGDTNKALRQGGKFMNGVGYTDLGAGMNTVANKADAFDATRKAIKTGDVGTGLEAAGTFAGLSDVAATGQKINQAKRVKQAADQGDIANAVYGAGNLVDSDQLMEAGWQVYHADAAKRAIENGDAAAAASSLGGLTGSKALTNTGGTIRDVQNAKEYADAGQYGNAIYSLGSAAGNNKVKKLGDQVDATEEAALAAQGKDRYGNTISDAERIAGVLGGVGRATDSNELLKGARATRQADSLAQAIDKRQQSQALSAAGDLTSTMGRKQASDNIRNKADEERRRERLAEEIGDEIDGERTGALVDRVAQAQGIELQKLEADKEAKEFEKQAQKLSKVGGHFGNIGDVLTGGGSVKDRIDRGKQVAETLKADPDFKG